MLAGAVCILAAIVAVLDHPDLKNPNREGCHARMDKKLHEALDEADVDRKLLLVAEALAGEIADPLDSTRIVSFVQREIARRRINRS
jgi:hypothetical protein